ncbi:MAG: lactate utilization protein LutB domain-containing protein, partial [Terriglobia bacterium]
YRKAGGHSYGWVYSGPIGAVLNPQLLGNERAAELPFASSLCGACGDVCPVKIPLPDLLLELRAGVAQRAAGPPVTRAKRFWMRLWAAAMRTPWRYRLATACARAALRRRARDGYLRSLPGPFGAWTAARDFPAPAVKPFRALWKELGK